MLEIICAGSFALSINVCLGEELSDLTVAEKAEILESNVIKQDLAINRGYLAEMIANESEYRKEADREGERHEINAPDENREDRVYRDAEQRRREDGYEGRVYRDAEQRRREDEYEGRVYRDTEQRRREDYSEEEKERYERRDREDYESEESRSLLDLFENWLSE